ncbi:MAG TPA: DinB family protein [Chitinophagaceae bacterium]|nr:DinB family protein [Chitinophagaceae bacterium]
MPKPNINDYPEYFGKYINQVSEEDLSEAFRNQFPKIESFLLSISEEKAGFAYAPGKWTLKELLQHTIDTERIFNYRALCFARKETASLPSFDENLYAENSNANKRSWKSLSSEFINVRRSTEDLFNSFSDGVLQQKGSANNNNTSVLSLGFILIGHVYHHIKVVEERYR